MNSEQKTGKEAIEGRLLLGRAVLAPMTGISDVVFRRIAMRFGAPLVVTEMVASAGYVRRSAEAQIKADGEGISPHVVQLVGRDPAVMGEAAKLAEGSGADAIDLNFGCPAKRVTGGLAGSALMRQPDLASAIVEAVLGSVAVPVTVKMRLGWDDQTRNAAILARLFVASGVSALTVHGRTRQQFYAGQADWAAIRDVVEAVDRPVTANGDIDGVGSARLALDRSGAASVMIGRAAMGQPWLIGVVARALGGVECVPPTYAERAGAAVEHFEGLLTLYGREIGRRCARKHLAAYADTSAREGFGLSEQDRRELVTSEEPARVAALLGRLYDAPARMAA